MNRPTPAVEAEIRAALATNDGNLGRVYALLAEGKSTNRELVEGGAAANSGAASNTKTIIAAMLEGAVPGGPSLAAQAGRAIGGMLRANPELSPETKEHLASSRNELDEHSRDPAAVAAEDRHLNQASEKLEDTIENLDGVYVYTFPTYFRTVQKTDPERFLYKIGMTDRYSKLRIREQQRATNMPEDPLILRVYRSSRFTPRELEARFHALLDAAGHDRSSGKSAGREWFYTNLDLLDAVAALLELEVRKAEISGE
jgi:hypothetical protein